MSPLDGENLMVNKWPPSLPAALQRWGTTQPKSPCLTALDNAGKPVYTLTYGGYSLALQLTGQTFQMSIIHVFCVFYFVGKLWTRCQKLAYTLLNKLSTRNEPLLVPGDRVSHPRRKAVALLQTLLTSCKVFSLWEGPPFMAQASLYLNV